MVFMRKILSVVYWLLAYWLLAYRLSLICYWVSAVGFCLSVIGCRLSVIGYRLLLVGCRLFAYRLSANISGLIQHVGLLARVWFASWLAGLPTGWPAGAGGLAAVTI
jgi:hypothetical protein